MSIARYDVFMLAKFFYDLAKYSFAGMVVAVFIGKVPEASAIKVLILGIVSTVGFALAGYFVERRQGGNDDD